MTAIRSHATVAADIVCNPTRVSEGDPMLSPSSLAHNARIRRAAGISPRVLPLDSDARNCSPTWVASQAWNVLRLWCVPGCAAGCVTVGQLFNFSTCTRVGGAKSW
jgi:hypothetical protein